MLAHHAVGRQPGHVLLWTVVYCLSCSFLSQPHEESSHLLVTATALPARARVCEEMGYFFPYLDGGVIAALKFFGNKHTEKGVCKASIAWLHVDIRGGSWLVIDGGP